MKALRLQIVLLASTIAVTAAVGLFAAAPGLADTLPSAPCIGYNHETKSWRALGAGVSVCPPDHALLSVLAGTGDAANPAERPLTGSCCPLPRGILTSEMVVAPLRCPPDTVAAGFVISERKPTTYHLYCAAIDTARFKTGEVRLGAEVTSVRGHLGDFVDIAQGKDPHRIPPSRIPAAYRYSVGRSTRTKWDFPACIGVPFEGVLVGRFGKRCVEHEFSTILDRITGQPVPLFSKCEQVNDPLDPEAKCVNP